MEVIYLSILSFNGQGAFTLPDGMLGISCVPAGHCVLLSGVTETKAQPLPSRRWSSNAERVEQAQFSLTCAGAKCTWLYGA